MLLWVHCIMTTRPLRITRLIMDPLAPLKSIGNQQARYVSILTTWVHWEPPGSLWVHWEHLDPLRTTLLFMDPTELLGSTGNRQPHYVSIGYIVNHSAHYGSIGDHLDPLDSVWVHYDHFRSLGTIRLIIMGRLRPFRCIGYHQAPYGPIWAIWVYWEPLVSLWI